MPVRMPEKPGMADMWARSTSSTFSGPRVRSQEPKPAAQPRSDEPYSLTYSPLSKRAWMPRTTAVSPTGANAGSQSVEKKRLHCAKTVETTLWTEVMRASSSSKRKRWLNSGERRPKKLTKPIGSSSAVLAPRTIAVASRSQR